MKAYLLLGLINGLSYALLALGMVLVYKAGRFLNLAHAQLGVVSALLLGKMVLDWGLPWLPAFAVAVGVGALTGAVVEVGVIRRLAGRGKIALLIASIGISQILLAATYWDWLGPNRQRLALDGYPLPFDVAIDVDALRLGGQHVMILLLVPVLAIGLAFTFQRTLIGRCIRAAASNPEAAELAGISVKRLSTVAWAAAGAFAATSAILQAPSQAAFDTEALGPTLLLRALGAAAIGGFTSLPAAFGGGIGLGLLEGLVLHLTGDAGAAQAWLLVAILLTLMIRGSALARGDALDSTVDISKGPIAVPDAVRDRFYVRYTRHLVAGGALFIALLAPRLPIWESSGKQFLLALTVIFAVVALSVTVLTGWAGQLSLGQFAFVGAGALLGARLIGNGWSVAATMLICGVLGAVMAAAIGLPALRLPGLTLAVSTLGFAVVGPSWLFRQEWFSPTSAVTVATPKLAVFGPIDGPRDVYYLALAVLLVALVCLHRLRRAAAGRLFVAVRDNPTATSSLGISPTAVRLSAFALSGFLATAGGVLWLAAWRSVSVELMPAQQSLLMLSIAVVGGVASLAGAVVGSLAIFGLPALTADWMGSIFTSSIQFQLFVAGTGLVVTQIANPGGIVEAAREQWERALHRVGRSAASRARPAVGSDVVLRAEDIVVRFGGVVAVDGATIEVREGEIVGLIGTNGAGKTTLLNAICGHVPVSSGRVLVNGRDVSGLGPEFRSHFGLARSFQDARLFPGLTVTETVQVAISQHRRTGVIAALTGAPWQRAFERADRARAESILEQLGLGAWADVQVAELSTGTRRICDLAAQIASEPDVLLLDEPTAGVAQREAETFGPMLRDLARAHGWSVLVIEHDMPLLMGLADRIYCLERGRVISEGTPSEVREDATVVASYLGTTEAAIARSGGEWIRPRRPKTRPLVARSAERRD